MPEGTRRADVVVVGGGVIGLTLAWRARAKGLSVTVLERGEIGMGTSHVAAGMLAPVAEVEFGDAGQAVLELGLHSAEMWPEFAAELERCSGEQVGLLRTGTLVLARDEDEARELERQIAFRESLGLRTTRLRASVSRRSRRPHDWGWKRQRTTRLIHAWCSWRCAGYVSASGWSCACTRPSRASSWIGPAHESRVSRSKTVSSSAPTMW